MGTNKSGMNPSHTKYLKAKRKQLQEHESEVIVMIDEINCKSNANTKEAELKVKLSIVMKQPRLPTKISYANLY